MSFSNYYKTKELEKMNHENSTVFGRGDIDDVLGIGLFLSRCNSSNPFPVSSGNNFNVAGNDNKK
jgi:hypothetical protein